MRPFADATGEVDYGSIDAWTLRGDVSHIEGDWGELEVAGGDVTVQLDSASFDAHEPWAWYSVIVWKLADGRDVDEVDFATSGFVRRRIELPASPLP